MENFDIKKYIEIALRRKYWIVIPFMLVLLGGLAYILKAPKIYESKTLILVQEQKVPEDYVRSIVSSDSSDRLQTISQQVTSRTNLEKIIADNKLYEQGEMLIEEKVSLLRRTLQIDVTARSGRNGGGNAFTISFQGKDPRKVMQVTNALASNFISENLKIRESQAQGTLNFIADELDSVRKELLEQEEQLKIYKEKYRGGLPEQLNTNLRILERLQGQLEQLNSNLRAVENRKIILQQGITSSSSGGIIASGYFTPQQNAVNELESLKSELETLQSRYTDKHPDIINLRTRIASLETQVISSFSEDAENNSLGEEEFVHVDGAMTFQLNDIQLEISTIKEEIEKVNNKVKWYEIKVEDTPKREQELLSLNRDYDSFSDSYSNLLERKREAELSVSMERKQKGEQFRVIDPAQIPLKPVKPDVQKLIIMVIGLGLGLGCSIGYLVEMLDTSYRSPDDVEKDLELPVLICLPYLFTEQELSARRKRRILIATSMVVSYGIALSAVVIFIKGYGETVDFIRDILMKLGVA